MNEDFVSTYTPYAQDIAAKTGIHPSVILGIIAQETGHGTHIAGNNPFGISPDGKVAAYPDIESGGKAFVDLMGTKRYAGIRNGKSPDAQAIALGLSGYNPNPSYGVSVATHAAKFRSSVPLDVTDAPSEDDLLNRRGYGSKGPKAKETVVPEVSEDDLLKRRGFTPTPVPPTYEYGSGPDSAAGNAKAADWGIPTGGPPKPVAAPVAAPTTPADDAAILSDAMAQGGGGGFVAMPTEQTNRLGAAMAEGYKNGPTILTPPVQAALEKDYPAVGAVTGAGDAILRSGNALFQGGLHALAATGDAIVPPNAGGSFGRAIAGVAESETARTMAERPISPALVEPDKHLVRPDPNIVSDKFSEASDHSTRVDQLDGRNNSTVNGTDNFQYVPGTQPPLPQREPTDVNVGKYKIVDDNSGAMAKAQQADNEARIAHAATIDISASREAALNKTRRAQADVDLEKFHGDSFAEPVEAKTLIDDITTSINTEHRGRPVITEPLKTVRDSIDAITDGDGWADPKELYNVRQSINDMLDRSNPNNAGNIQARKELIELGGKIDDKLDQASYMNDFQEAHDKGDSAVEDFLNNPNYEGAYSKYKKNYAKNSEPLNEIHALRDAGFDNLTDTNGVMTHGRVQKVIDNLIDGVKSKDRDVLSVSDETWNKLFNLRDDLRRKEAVISPSGNIRTGAQPPRSVMNDLHKKIEPSKVANALTWLTQHGVTAGVNMLLSHGHMGAGLGTGIDFGSEVIGNRVRAGLARKSGVNALNTFTNDLMNLHPEWRGRETVPYLVRRGDNPLMPTQPQKDNPQPALAEDRKSYPPRGFKPGRRTL